MAKAQWHGEIFKRNLENPKKEYLMKCGFYVEGETKRLCPTDTGTLRSSYHTKYNPLEVAAYVGTSADRMKAVASEKLSRYKTSKMTARRSKLTGISTGSTVFYAPYVEFGTWKMPARPHLRPALDKLRTKVATRGSFAIRNPI